MAEPLNTLFLCTGNSARSILAEALLNRLGEGRFRAWSAGSIPKGAVNPHAFPLTRALGFRDDDFRSKPWDEFATPDAPDLDFVITVCDNARDVCPVFPDSTTMLHWSFEDPASAIGSEEERVAEFRRIRDQISTRFDACLN